MVGNWSELDHILLVEIAQRIRLYNDFVAFRCTCTAWRSAAILKNFTYKTTQIPWLMLAQRKNTNVRDFFDIFRNKITRQVLSPEAKVRKCYSSKGWLLSIARDLSISLLHPFTRRQIPLPGIMGGFKDWEQHQTYPMQFYFIWKCELTSSPSYTSDYVVMVIYGDISKLAYLKSGDTAWTTIKTFEGAYSDVIYRNQHFYAMTFSGKLIVFGGDDLTVAKEIIDMPNALFEKPFCGICYCKKFYVVESESEATLLIVARLGVQLRPLNGNEDDVVDEDHLSELTYGTLGFQVFELNLSSKTWTTIKNLGNKTLFLGHNSSFSLKVSDDTQCNPNSIYFTDDCMDSYPHFRKGGGKDMGIYSMKDRRIVPLKCGKSYHPITPPMWVEQTFE